MIYIKNFIKITPICFQISFGKLIEAHKQCKKINDIDS
jgi:hypothetical protein